MFSRGFSVVFSQESTVVFAAEDQREMRLLLPPINVYIRMQNAFNRSAVVSCACKLLFLCHDLFCYLRAALLAYSISIFFLI